MIFTAIWNGWIGYVPPIESIENPIDKYASQIISEDNVLLGTWAYNENRIMVKHEEIAPCLFEALIATEDKRFYEHSGIDFKAMARAIIKRGILRQTSAGGGSTITQQLAKQLYSEASHNSAIRIMQKTNEWVIALKLERYYSKDEIMTLYLNYFDFLHHAVGIKTATKVYFNKTPREITIPEAALLIGMCKNPSLYNPIRDQERAKNRRNTVLELMEQSGYISKEECENYKNQDLGINFQPASHKLGLGTYVREYLRHIMTAKKPNRSNYASWQNQEFFDDSLAWERNPLYGWCNKNKKKDGSTYNIYTDGLKIYTTINSRMQQYAEASVREHLATVLQPAFEKEKKSSSSFPFSTSLTPQQIKQIIRKAITQSECYKQFQAMDMSEEEIDKAMREKVPMTIFTYSGEKDTLMSPLDSILYYKKFLRAGFMSMDPITGHVKAYVGGPDYAYFQYDMCMMGRRQVGSTIKPYLYALAMESGMTPFDEVLNEQPTFMVNGQPWSPRNTSNSRIGEMVTLKWGLAQSNNWISAYLINKLGAEALVSIMRAFGITSLNVYPSLALCLGTCDLSVAEMVSAYTAFANNGIHTEPLFVTKIENSEGEVIATFKPNINEAISKESSYYMLDMMQEVVNSGTGTRLRYRYGLTAQIAAKTGTTNNNSDGWFMGVTPRLVSGCWVGGENRDIHFDHMAMGQGASMALPIWAKYMKRVYADRRLGYSQSEVFNIDPDFNLYSNKDSIPEDMTIDNVFQ